MPSRDDEPLSPLAQQKYASILRAARIAEMRDSADEISRLMEPPAPGPLPSDPDGLRQMLAVERQRYDELRRLLVGLLKD